MNRRRIEDFVLGGASRALGKIDKSFERVNITPKARIVQLPREVPELVSRSDFWKNINRGYDPPPPEGTTVLQRHGRKVDELSHESERLQLYHATRYNFNIFDLAEQDKKRGLSRAGEFYGRGIYLTPHREVAEDLRGRGFDNFLTVEATFKKPYDWTLGENGIDLAYRDNRAISEKDRMIPWATRILQDPEALSSTEFSARLQEKGYDSIIAPNAMGWTNPAQNPDEWVALDPSKSLRITHRNGIPVTTSSARTAKLNTTGLRSNFGSITRNGVKSRLRSSTAGGGIPGGT